MTKKFPSVFKKITNDFVDFQQQLLTFKEDFLLSPITDADGEETRMQMKVLKAGGHDADIQPSPDATAAATAMKGAAVTFQWPAAKKRLTKNLGGDSKTSSASSFSASSPSLCGCDIFDLVPINSCEPGVQLSSERSFAV